MSGRNLIIWDSSESVPKNDSLIYCWNGYYESRSVHSLLTYIEQNAGRLREKYLAWIHDLGESVICGKRLIDHLALGDGFSYWWMSLFVEKSPYKSPISEAIKLLAIEEIIIREKAGSVLLVTGNKILNQTIFALCRKLGVDYEWKRVAHKRTCIGFRDIYNTLPYPVRALGSLILRVLQRWPLRRLNRDGWFEGDRIVFLCSYFIHLDEKSCSEGRFYSRQWEILPSLLHKAGFRINWIHHYLKSSVVHNTRLAMGWMRKFNQQRDEQGFHAFLDTFLSGRVLWCVFKRWMWLTYLTLRLKRIKGSFCPEGSLLSLWPIMRRDWYSFMYGPTAISNLFWMELFTEALKSIPHQKIGLYLCENQSWERALIHAWKKYGHGKLIAVAHSTVRFWDLRYFTDPRSMESTGPYPMPQPDAMALNGKAAVNVFKEAKQPMDKIVEAEALRYMHLNVGHPRVKPRSARYVEMLILGDVMAQSTKKLLELLDNALPMLAERFSFTIKPHPCCMVRADDFPRLRLKIVTDALGTIMGDYDIAYASNSTSAGVDAYLAGLPVVVMLDENELNMSPLRGQPGAEFVSTPAELAKAVESAKEHGGEKSARKDFFFLDPELPKLRRLIGLVSLDIYRI